MLRLVPSLCFVLIFTVNCKEPSRETGKDDDLKAVTELTSPIPFYVGTYTGGASKGIYQYALSADGILEKNGLVAESENPSFLSFSPDGQFLLAVNEVNDPNGQGYVSSYKIDQDTLIALDRKPSGGAHPCHIAVNANGFVLVANYSGGNMGLLKIQRDGHLSDLLDVQQHTGGGTHSRQEAPHAHSGWFTQDQGLISVDLGTNQLWFSEIDPQSEKFKPRTPRTFTLEPGAGPRHLAFHPQNPWIYVVNELSSSVSLLKRASESKEFTLIQTLSTLPPGFDSENTCADIHISEDGKFLYASNRGHNSIAVYSLDAATGELDLIGHETTRGETPRNFSLSPGGRFLLVANQNTNTVVSFRRDPTTGLLKYTDQIEAPSPVCILFKELTQEK